MFEIGFFIAGVLLERNRQLPLGKSAQSLLGFASLAGVLYSLGIVFFTVNPLPFTASITGYLLSFLVKQRKPLQTVVNGVRKISIVYALMITINYLVYAGNIFLVYNYTLGFAGLLTLADFLRRAGFKPEKIAKAKLWSKLAKHFNKKNNLILVATLFLVNVVDAAFTFFALRTASIEESNLMVIRVVQAFGWEGWWLLKLIMFSFLFAVAYNSKNKVTNSLLGLFTSITIVSYILVLLFNSIVYFLVTL